MTNRFYRPGLRTRDYWCDICKDWMDGSLWQFNRLDKEAVCPDNHYFHTSEVMSRMGASDTPRPLF